MAGEADTEPSQAQVRAFWHLERKFEAFLETDSLSMAPDPVSAIFERREVTYGGSWSIGLEPSLGNRWNRASLPGNVAFQSTSWSFAMLGCGIF